MLFSGLPREVSNLHPLKMNQISFMGSRLTQVTDNTCPNRANIPETHCADRDVCHRSQLAKVNKWSGYHAHHEMVIAISHKAFGNSLPKDHCEKRAFEFWVEKDLGWLWKRVTQMGPQGTGEIFLGRECILRRNEIMSKQRYTTS